VSNKPLEIKCTACAADAWLRREAVYEGFKKTGETLRCSACGHEFASEAEVPFKARKIPRVFTDADRSKTVEIFRGDEKGRNCRHCRHYVVNPFVQRCGLHHREVKATDLCADFSPPEPKPDADLPPNPPGSTPA
jgi:hypothetical protein